MKLITGLFLLLFACEAAPHGPKIPHRSSLDNESVCPSESLIDCYPEGSPSRRNDLYECKNGGSAHAWVEFMNDKSRLYHVWLRLPEGLTESFVAEESSEAAEPFTPIAYGLGMAQSSRVLHGMLSLTKETLGLDDRNFSFTLVGGGEERPVTMTVATDMGEDLGIKDLRCERVGN